MDIRAKLLGHSTITQLVDFGTARVPGPTGTEHEITAGTVKDFKSMARLHTTLLGLGFQLHQNGAFGPAGGRQLFYVNDATRMNPAGKPVMDGILVRIKTMGNAVPPRKGVPHLSVSLYTAGLDWPAEKSKFDVYGQVTPKIPADSLSSLAKDVWAHACHFNFRPGFDFAGASNLCPGNFALRDALWSAFR